jgi:putative transcriptional regulator
MEYSPLANLKGQFLIAMPHLMEPAFFQTVVLICEHNEGGAMGMVVNRVHPVLRCGEIFEEIQLDCISTVASVPVHIGGPVHGDEIFILHGPPLRWDGSLVISPDVALSNTMDLMMEISCGRGPEHFIIALGCAGWAPGQLENELKENVWLNTGADKTIMFQTDVAVRWETALQGMGVDPLLFSGEAGHA